MTRPVTPAQAYKDVIDGLITGADGLREREQERATELADGMPERYRKMLRAVDLASSTRIVMAMRWEEALEVLWTESSWLTLRLRPDPPPDPRIGADVDRLMALVEEMEARSAALQAAVRRRFGLPGR